MYETTFRARWDQYRERDGQPVQVIRVIEEPDAKHDAEVLPMFEIRFPNDDTYTEAWPEELLDGQTPQIVTEAECNELIRLVKEG